MTRGILEKTTEFDTEIDTKFNNEIDTANG